MSQTAYIQELTIDFEQYHTDLVADLQLWDNAIDGTIANRVFQTFCALNRLHLKIVFIERRKALIERMSSLPADARAELLREYERLLVLMYPMRQWYEVIRDDYRALQTARRNGDWETARELEEELDLEPGHV
ncbi:uncharacterized protein EAF01_002919 [Botrytis porri]|uniref:Uncharacterized protein n=1 Tax=Botrytis porri TaxID=87229 RepID=A0A4Z1K931_9HELO|nr:uncharacterized protein EAF01_002919 [Botrytis porri]KAF7911412.1 hypothetical protein EAF01_002919 [Botrytis porri]TGO81958.1 hypothetical protein BPOR_0961g00020 [Botrytis porri]